MSSDQERSEGSSTPSSSAENIYPFNSQYSIFTFISNQEANGELKKQTDFLKNPQMNSKQTLRISSPPNLISGDNFSQISSPHGGIFLINCEKTGLFPIVHWSYKSTDDLTHLTQMNHNLTLKQGTYKELKKVIPPDAWILSPKEPGPDTRTAWLLIGYKSLEKTLDSTLEATWKEWTGTRHIYLNLRNDFEIRRMSFFTRVDPPEDLDLFMYIVLVEVGNVVEKSLVHLKDFVAKTRIERMKGFFSVYSEAYEDEEFANYSKFFSSPHQESSFNSIGSRSTRSTQSPTSSINSTSSVNEDLTYIESILKEICDSPI